MKLISWNVNGIRSIAGKGFSEVIQTEKPDIICLQEVKAQADQVDHSLFADYKLFWNGAVTKGYSGTAIASRQAPKEVLYGMGLLDDEGRVIALRFDNFWLVNVYTPNSGRDLERLNFRESEWDKKFLEFLLHLEKTAPVIACGDLNVAHEEIDLANPKTNRKNAGFTAEERRGFANFIEAGFVDVFRHKNPDLRDQYTWWSYRPGIRARNIGWRIDYFLASKVLIEQVKKADILSQVMGSDHCPITLELTDIN